MRGTVVKLNAQADVTLGRSAQASIVIPDPHLSRIHARVFTLSRSPDAEFFIEDCGSANGTFILDQRISAPMALVDGTWIGLGRQTVLSFSTHAHPGEEAKDTLRDPLTGLLSRVAFEQYLRSDVVLSDRVGSPLTVLIFQVDRFLSLSDGNPHQEGDPLLRQVVLAVQATLRRQDVLGYCGGGRFAAILHGVTRRAADEMAYWARSAVQGSGLKWSSTGARATVSVGGVHLAFGDWGTADVMKDSAVIVDLATAALDDAEAQGGNRVVMVARGWGEAG